MNPSRLLALFLSGACVSEAAIFFTQADLAESEVFAMDDRFQSVGMISRYYDGRWIHTGSAILIAPNWVLTAAHVIDAVENRGYESIRFGLGHDGLNPDVSATITLSFKHPDYTGDYLHTPDLGLFYLSTPITSVEPATRFYGTDPAPPIPSWDTARQPQYAMAGYGRAGVVNTTAVDDGIKRAGTNGVDAHGGAWGADPMYMLSDFAARNASYLEWNGSPGDSGGGWFYNVDGEWQLSGVISFTNNSYTQELGTSGALRVSLFNDWIDQTIASIPEPSSFASLALSGVLLLTRRRKAA